MSIVVAETVAPRGDALEVALHLVGALVAVVRILGERAHHDHVELARDVAAAAVEGGCGVVERCFIAISTGVSPSNGVLPVSSS